MNANTPVKIAAGALALGVVLVLLNTWSGPKAEQGRVVVAGGSAMSQEALAGLGIEGDTEKDVVATLIGEVRSLKRDITTLRDDNRGLRSDNEDFKKMENTIGRRLAGQLSEVESSARQETQAQYETMLRRLQEAEASLADRYATARHPGGPAVSGQPIASSVTAETLWVQPLGREAGDAGSGNSVFGQARQDLSNRIGVAALPGVRGRNDVQDTTVKPVYTLAKNATLVNSTALTALIGRVPIGSQVTDPYSFKLIIGKDNLIANGVELPEVAYSIASGKAIGDWTLGCVRGDVHSITFVFEDGTIRTVPKANTVFEGNGQSQEIKIGELSDAYGNPCVVGERISNAYTYLAQRIGVTAAAAAAEAAAASQTTVLASTGGGGIGTSVAVDGSTSQYILGKTIADGTLEVADWLDERQAQQFDAIYVAPGADVSLHITEQIEIDYDTVGRKTNHLGLSQGGYRALD